MSDKKLKIIIFDGSFKTTTFINRLVEGLVNEYDVYIVGFNEQLNYKIPKVHYVPLGSNQNYFRLSYVSLKYAFKTKQLKRISNVVKKLLHKDRKGLQEQNLEIALSDIDPDIIHLQWLSNIQLFEKYITLGTYKFILSQRGYHINIRPFINATNFKYLQQWYPKIDGFHSVSNAIKLVSEKIYTASNKIDHVVYSGFNLHDIPYNNEYKKRTSRIEILSVGRDNWIKGYVYAIEAMSVLLSKGVDFQYTIVGVGRDCEELRYLINEYKLTNNVTLLASVAQEAVYEQMKNCNIVLLPSLLEGVANVCIEAMAIGTPVISTECGGMVELITDKVSGFLVPTRNATAIADKIIDYTKLTNSELSMLRLNARAVVERQHSADKMVKDMKFLYTSVYENN